MPPFQVIIQALQGQSINPQQISIIHNNKNMIDMTFFEFLLTQQLNTTKQNTLVSLTLILQKYCQKYKPLLLKFIKLTQQNNVKLDLALLQQFDYDRIEYNKFRQWLPITKPKVHFLDSTFFKELPVSKHNAIINLNEQFNFTLVKKSQEDDLQNSKLIVKGLMKNNTTLHTGLALIQIQHLKSQSDHGLSNILQMKKKRKLLRKNSKLPIQKSILINRTRSQRKKIRLNSKEQDRDLFNRKKLDDRQFQCQKSILQSQLMIFFQLSIQMGYIISVCLNILL
ncbi:unnamed protein product [Paramecium octaurelia]|uniref:Uncharacterized protein n=1 Tax=Paramecium octaurelia TaxID=43137 RepID=A0A8S1VR58_PAROT|nr:unnamed protein product [Paramecium octaurelia]